MEDYQRSYISRNLESLIENTICNPALLAGLTSKDLLSSEEYESINVTSGNRRQAQKLYEILVTRLNAYSLLMECLKKTKQSGAFNTLSKIKTPEHKKQVVSDSVDNTRQSYYSCSESSSKKEGQRLPREVLSTESCPDFQVRPTLEDENPSIDKKIKAEESTSNIIYDTTELLGVGRSSSKVYKGKLSVRDVAVKVYNSKCYDIALQLRHIEMLKELEHKNILQFFNHEFVDGYLLIAFEFCFTSLDHCIETSTFPLNKYELCVQTTEGLKYLHDNDIVHGRLIPENVLLKKLKNDVCIVKISGLGRSDGNLHTQTVFSDDIFLLGCVFDSTLNIKNGSAQKTACDNASEVTTIHDPLSTRMNAEINSLIQIMKNENPSQRPDCSYVMRRLKGLNTNHEDRSGEQEFQMKVNPIAQLDNKNNTVGANIETRPNSLPNTTFSSSPYISLNTKFFPKINSETQLLASSDYRVILGIDLGTDKCCVAFAQDNKVHIFSNVKGKSTFASYVSFEENGTVIIGEDAKQRAFQNPKHTVYESKRMIGRSLNDANLLNAIPNYAFDIVTDKNALRCQLEHEWYYPEQISAFLIRSCVDLAEEVLKTEDIKHAVITIPAYFTDAQKAATEEAGRLAGLDTIHLLYEPTAAAIAYSHSQAIEEPKRVLIFDLGGGTFNVAIVDFQEDGISIVGYGGDTFIGGNNFHDELYKYCIDAVNEQYGVQIQCRSLRALRNMSLIRTQCEIRKIELDSSDEVTIFVPCIIQEIDMNITITRQWYNQITKHLVDRLMQIVAKTLAKSKVVKDSLDDILLIGASTRAPMIQERIRELFIGKPITIRLSSDDTIAYGAALYAAYLSKVRSKRNLLRF